MISYKGYQGFGLLSDGDIYRGYVYSGLQTYV